MADANLINSWMLARGYMMHIIGGVSDDQMLDVPAGAHNNILWNLGHLAHAHTGLTYGPCDIKPPVPDSYEGLFKGGTSPSDWSATPDLGEVKETFHATHAKILEDYQAGVFDGYKSRELMPGVNLANVEQALGFNCIHEGVHIGTIISILNLMKK